MRPTTVHDVLRQAHTRAFLVTNPINLRYLTGLSLSTGAALLTEAGYELFVDSRYHEAAQSAVASGITVSDVGQLGERLKRPSCGFEADFVTVERLQSWRRRYPGTRFVARVGVIEWFRRTKEPDELTLFRRAQRITQQMMKTVPSLLTVGCTEREVAWALQGLARELGADGLSFEPIVAFGDHTSRPHHHPENRRLRRNDVVQIDVGARVGGYCADQSDVFSLEPFAEEVAQIHRAVREAQTASLLAIRPGASSRDIDAIARKKLQQYGLNQYFNHALGHGLGLEIHEGISLSSHGPARRLKSGEILTVEPGVYVPEKFGIRLEREVIV